MELVKPTIRVGNSAGVLLPKEWLNMNVKVVLQPLNVEKEILEILLKEGILQEVEGVYLVGSYARKEETFESDIDVLVITNNLDKNIKEGKYEIICVSKKQFEKQLETNILPILPMLVESKVIINKNLKESYLNSSLTGKNLRWHIETTKKMMKKVKEDIEFSRKIGMKISDASAYSLVLRLRTLYIINCLRKNKSWSKKEFLRLIKKISGSLTVYYEYLRVKKKDKKLQNKLPIDEAEKLMDYINKEMSELEKWLKEKKD